MYVRTYIFIYVSMSVCMNIYIMHVCIYVRMSVCIAYMYVCKYGRLFTIIFHVYIQAYVHCYDAGLRVTKYFQNKLETS